MRKQIICQLMMEGGGRVCCLIGQMSKYMVSGVNGCGEGRHVWAGTLSSMLGKVANKGCLLVEIELEKDPTRKSSRC